MNRLLRISRRVPLALLGALLLELCSPFDAAAFNLDDVAAKAAKLAQEPFQDPRGHVPDWMLKMTYDQWRDIRFRPDRALWKNDKLPFQVQFFHAGLYYDRTVLINIIDDKGAHPLPFSPSDFDYGRNEFASNIPQDLGVAGFRLHYPIKTRNYFDEVIVFLGASYFRALGKNEVFGLSARGIAIDTAAPSGEEFPYFREFWLEKPKPKAKTMTIYALLDSPGLTGAYQFVVKPGEATDVDVDGRLFLRREVDKVGVAALTSMYFHGENTRRWFDDFRPEVHDSDGLLLHFDTGEWLWRPLDNPRALNVSQFKMKDPKGFGLLQRDRAFDHYQDLETRSEQRPSVWVTPNGAWGNGRVELIEIPTNSDINDNITVFWVPEKRAKPGEPFAFAYTMTWYGDNPKLPPEGRVISTRRDPGTIEDAERFVIDFSGKKLDAIPADTVLRGIVTIASGPDAGELIGQQVIKNPITNHWRLTFQVRPKRTPLELRAFLDKGGEALTETWSYVILP